MMEANSITKSRSATSNWIEMSFVEALRAFDLECSFVEEQAQESSAPCPHHSSGSRWSHCLALI
jgi:hypothetical protein